MIDEGPCVCDAEERCIYHQHLVQCLIDGTKPPEQWPEAKEDMWTLWKSLEPKR